MLALDGLAYRGRRFRGGQIGRDDRRAAELGRQLLESLTPPRDEDQTGIGLAREPAGRRLADAARGAGDHRYEWHETAAQGSGHARVPLRVP